METKEVYAKCRRGGDLVTAGTSCNSLKAELLSEPGSHVTKFKCKKCGYTWAVAVGGNVTL